MPDYIPVALRPGSELSIYPKSTTRTTKRPLSLLIDGRILTKLVVGVPFNHPLATETITDASLIGWGALLHRANGPIKNLSFTLIYSTLEHMCSHFLPIIKCC